ncbi:MAG: septum formation initiator family protein [Deltaproteobacteria bacterium]|nr:septum formation initiator family protein [Deltaproteobacteria bacterium]
MKVGRYLIIFVLLMGTIITFGNRGLVDNYLMRERLAVLRKYNQELSSNNLELRKKIVLLRSNLPYIEQVARNELGMIKKGDLVYRSAE